MNNTDYNPRLYEKMKAEQDRYRDWLLYQEPAEILNHIYEYTVREDIVMCMNIYIDVTKDLKKEEMLTYAKFIRAGNGGSTVETDI